ncbi:hypothetical protein Tco_0338561 [Tanacetum coccineum]
MLNKGRQIRQIRQTFRVKVEGDVAYGVRAMLYIAGVPRDLGVVNPFAIFGAINVFGDFKKPVALLCSTKSCLSATIEDGELYRFAREDDSLDLECKKCFQAFDN